MYKLFHEVIQEGSPPAGIKLTTAPASPMGYNSPGEMSDWIMAATGIPAATPEIGTSDPRTNTFFIEDLDVIIDTLDANYPMTFNLFQKIGYELEPELLKHEYTYADDH